MSQKWWLLVVGVACVAVNAAPDRTHACEERWTQTRAAAQKQGGGVDAKHLLQQWLALEGQCSGTGVYEFRLAALYVQADQPKQALDVLSGAKSFPPQYASMIPLLRLRAQLMALAEETPVPMDRIRALKPQYLAALRSAPDQYEAYDQVANYMMLIDDAPEAITYGEKALAIREDEWDAHRSLAIAYQQTGDFVKSIVHARRAQELRNSLIHDPPFMYAVAKAYAGVGNITVAKKTLGILISAKPDERGSAAYRDAISFLVTQVKKGNVRN